MMIMFIIIIISSSSVCVYIYIYINHTSHKHTAIINNTYKTLFKEGRAAAAPGVVRPLHQEVRGQT